MRLGQFVPDVLISGVSPRLHVRIVSLPRLTRAGRVRLWEISPTGVSGSCGSTRAPAVGYGETEQASNFDRVVRSRISSNRHWPSKSKAPPSTRCIVGTSFRVVFVFAPHEHENSSEPRTNRFTCAPPQRRGQRSIEQCS